MACAAPFQRGGAGLPLGFGDSFGYKIPNAFDQFSRALVRQNAAFDRSLRQRPEDRAASGRIITAPTPIAKPVTQLPPLRISSSTAI